MEENTSKLLVGASLRSSPPAPSLAPQGGSALFVINLCASQAPVPNVAKSIPGLEPYRLYQVARVEDGRTRYRLRLGFFPTEADADTVLATVRQQYPTAFTTCLCDEDRKFTRGYLPDSAIAAPTSAPKRPVAVADAPVLSAKAATSAPITITRTPAAEPAPRVTAVAKPAVTASLSPAAPAGKPTATPVAATPAAPAKKAVPATSDVIELTWQAEENPPGAVAPVTANASHHPHPAKARAVAEDSVVELSWEPPSLTPPAPPSPENKAKVVPAAFSTQPVIKAPVVPSLSAETPPQKAPSAPPVAQHSHEKHGHEKPRNDKGDRNATSTRIPALELTLEKERAQIVAKGTPSAPAQPFHVGKGVDIPAVDLTLHNEPKSPAPGAAAHTAPAKEPAAAKTLVKHEPVAKAPAKPASPPQPPKTAPGTKPRVPGISLPELDSTQTIRALTTAELSDEEQEKWFAIQLAVSEQPVNLDTMPHLDIFEAYRLYSVASAGSGKITHSLRLGFFREEVSAEAVSGYLKTFFPTPTVVRISIAEQGRFKDPPTQKPAAKSRKADANIVDLNQNRAVRPVVPVVTDIAPAPEAAAMERNTSATGKFKTSSTGKHKTLPVSAKPAAKAARPATKRSEPVTKSRGSTTGKYKTLRKPSLEEQLLDEAREVQLSESAIRKLPKNDSLLSRLVGKLTK